MLSFYIAGFLKVEYVFAQKEWLAGLSRASQEHQVATINVLGVYVLGWGHELLDVFAVDFIFEKRKLKTILID